MQVQCPNCQTRFRVKDSHGGKWGICSRCNTRILLPIPDPVALLQWAQTAPYDKLKQFVSNGGGSGHSQDTIDKLVQVTEKRRWIEEDRVRATIVKKRAQPVQPIQLNQLDRIWEAAQRKEPGKLSLEGLRGLEPSRFESFIAELFTIQGYQAQAVGGPGDYGVDVEVRSAGGELWAVVQCKRYALQSRVSVAQVLEFAGAFTLSKAQQGFIFTTGELTRNAKKSAGEFQWLTVYSGPDLVQYMELVNQKCSSPAPVSDQLPDGE